ncbi:MULTISPECIES: RNA polymerase sigma factor [unclassified Burkholderia]|uniref:RNA polymerase sigma factor n=1 Tax=unclassified Burkholderia TaxID=2613784 RepID=UPI00215030CA|nr:MULTISPECIES: sigma-70 family RNA polymerase sigma factor [unclassified Burkholderia]MCR4469780.1 sigma-70 family RNA polymerase sigma factor [Burkholderia sp. SCN-KJ]
MVAHPVDETRIFWSSSAGRPAPAVIKRHGAQALQQPHRIEDTSPAVVFIDSAGTDACAEIEKLRIENGDEHYLIPMLREFSAERVVSLIARGANDAVHDEDLLDAEPVIARARAQTRLLSVARGGVAEFSALQSHSDGMVSPVFFKDANGLYTGCNRVFEHFLGIERASILGKTVYDVAPSDLALTYHKADLDLVFDGGVQTYTAGVRNGADVVRMVRFYKGVVYDQYGRITGIVGAMHDIGDLRGHETARHEIDEVTRHISGNPGTREDFASSVDHDRPLLDRVAVGDASALAALYRLYHRRLARFLTRLTWKNEVIEEIINDTFMVIWRRAGDFRGEARVSTWILGIAYRTALRALRDLRRAEFEPLDVDHIDMMAQYWHDHELSDLLSKALDLLPVEQRLVMTLAYVLGHSAGEIGEITGCPVTTVKARMHRARGKLRETLAVLEQAKCV